MKRALRQVIVLVLVAACAFLGGTRADGAGVVHKPCKPKTAKKCKKGPAPKKKRAVPNKPPIASFTFVPAPLGSPIIFDASASRDPDGTIISYSWSFDATGKTASAYFATTGAHSVTLTVTDNRGATARATRFVTVATPASTLTIGPGMPEPQANALKTGFEIAKSYFAKLGVSPDWHGDLYAEPTLDAIAADYAKVTGSEAFARMQCPSGCAFAVKRAVFVFPFGSSFYRPDELFGFMVTPVHELWHTVQYTYAPNMYGTGRDGLFTDGPTWLREGSADFIGYTAVTEAGFDASGLRNNSLYQLRNRFGGVSLESTAAGQGNGAAYSLGFFATQLLVQDTGSLHPLLDYWAKIGQGTDWPTAFQQAFGRTVEEFYAEFAAYRRTL